MSRRPLEPGEFGAISFSVMAAGTVKARVRVRLRSGDLERVIVTAPTEELARRRAQAEVTRRLNAAVGTADLGPRDTLAKAARQWVDQVRIESTWPDPPLRPQTVDMYEYLLRLYVMPDLGRYRLDALTPPVLQGWVNKMVARGQKPGAKHSMLSTTVRAHGVLHQVLERAVNLHALLDNPATHNRLPRMPEPEPVALTIEQTWKLRRAVRDWEKSRIGRPGPKPTGNLPVIFDMLLGTGLRIGEVMALRWGQVNLPVDGEGIATVSVETTLVNIKGKGVVDQGRPKTSAGKRVIILPKFLIEGLAQLRPLAAGAQDPVFPCRQFKDGSNAGTPQSPQNVRRALREVLDQTELTGLVHPHKLRHTVATLVQRDRGIEAAAALLGHSIKGVTGKHYVERISVAPDVSDVLQVFIEASEAAERVWLAEHDPEGDPVGSVADLQRSQRATAPRSLGS